VWPVALRALAFAGLRSRSETAESPRARCDRKKKSKKNKETKERKEAKEVSEEFVAEERPATQSYSEVTSTVRRIID
jgi:hypothetical protein